MAIGMKKAGYELFYNNPLYNVADKYIVGFRYAYDEKTATIRTFQVLFADKEACPAV